MDRTAARILETGTVTDDQGNSHPLHSHTSQEQCLFLQRMVTEAQAKTSLEIGLAYGLSALFICEVLQKQSAARHIIMDPFQSQWQNIGLKNIKDAGYNAIVDFREDFSHSVLPKLLAEGVTVDFAYVDTTKVFDIVLVDVYYIFQLLRVGGLLVMDDSTQPGLNKVVRFLAVHPCWKVYNALAPTVDTPGRKALSWACSLLPGKDKIFSSRFLNPDSKLGVNANCVVFQKISDDTRSWDWYKNF